MTGLRNRMVIEQDGRQSVSTVLLSTEEIGLMIDTEAWMHERAGWTVERYGVMLRCTRGDVIRWVWIRSKPPMEDILDA